MAKTASDGMTPQDVWAQLRADWLVIGEEGEQAREKEKRWVEQVSDRVRQLEAHQQSDQKSHRSQINRSQANGSKQLALVAETDLSDFLAGFLAALLAGWDVALANPHWGSREWTSLAALITPDIIWGQQVPLQSLLPSAVQPTRSNPAAEPAILIPTGGSTGHIKLARHTWSSLITSVSGFRHFFAPDGSPINAYCVLPVYHVSGLMPILRAWLSDAQVVLTPFKHLEKTFSSPLHFSPSVSARLSPSQSFISLVPTQLERLLQAGASAWLSQFKAVLLGGAPPWPALLDRARAQHIPLWLSYGMTETAAMVSVQSAQALSSSSPRGVSSGKALPHATLQIVKASQPLPAEQIGQVVVQSGAIAQGYYAQSSPAFKSGTFYTDDLGYLSADGHLYITGRASGKIISGGENIFPAEVEAAIRDTCQVKDVCVLGWPHAEWGEMAIALYVPAHDQVSAASLRAALLAPRPEDPTPALSRYKHPKQWVPVQDLPRNRQGKLNRAAVLAQLQAQLQAQSSEHSTPLSNRTAQSSADDGGGSGY